MSRDPAVADRAQNEILGNGRDDAIAAGREAEFAAASRAAMGRDGLSDQYAVAVARRTDSAHLSSDLT